MTKKTLLTLSVAGALTIGSTAAIVLAYTGAFTKLRATSYQMVLDENITFESKDMGFYHSVTIKNNEFDFLGLTQVNGKLGNIKKKNYNSVYDYNGMVYNRSVINGFTSLTVNFSGGDLYYTITDYLMEDMSFNKSHQATSGQTINITNNEGYFILYTEDQTNGVDINSITVEYQCDGSIDGEMLFNKNSTKGGARSTPSVSNFTDSYLEETNNPTTTTNNYSIGGNASHDYVWYRWNGRRFDNSPALQPHIELHTTILGNISQAVNAHADPVDNYFNYSVWPEFKMAGATYNNWEMIYIGNDNYEPLGHDSPDRVNPDDELADYSFAGRFIGAYKDYGGDNWQFADPDTTYTLNDTTKTYRDAYNAFTLPYWHIMFKIDMDTITQLVTIDTYVNGFKIQSSVMFGNDEESVNNYSGQTVNFNTYHMHCVNYGHADGSPAAKYSGVFTYPRFAVVNQ